MNPSLPGAASPGLAAPSVSSSSARATATSSRSKSNGFIETTDSSRLHRRVVAIVGGHLQELFGLVRPELGHHRVGMDHGVLQLSTHALDLEDVHVLRGIAVLVERDGPARIGRGLTGPADG